MAAPGPAGLAGRGLPRRIGQSVEKFLRHASPVVHFARNAKQDAVLGGQHISAGDQVVLFYCFGNGDEAVWEEPGRFDLSRPRRRHVAFGGGGVHYCMGNGVRRLSCERCSRRS